MNQNVFSFKYFIHKMKLIPAKKVVNKRRGNKERIMHKTSIVCTDVTLYKQL